MASADPAVECEKDRRSIFVFSKSFTHRHSFGAEVCMARGLLALPRTGKNGCPYSAPTDGMFEGILYPTIEAGHQENMIVLEGLKTLRNAVRIAPIMALT